VDSPSGLEKLVLVGAPNVGKSLLFNRLTGAYATVSNYPGTTVEIARGRLRSSGSSSTVLDTPGLRTLLALSEEEQVAKRILLEERPSLVIHVADAKDLERSLPLTFQLLELGRPVLLVLNMIDEAIEKGLAIDAEYLQGALGIPVVLTDAASGHGMAELRQWITQTLERQTPVECSFSYSHGIEEPVQSIVNQLHGSYPVLKRGVALLLLQGDSEANALVRAQEDSRTFEQLCASITEMSLTKPSFALQIALERQRIAKSMAARALGESSEQSISLRERLSRLTIHPVAGLPLLLFVLYGVYQIVGVFGAQTAVQFLEAVVFGSYINPWVTSVVQAMLPWAVLQELFVGQYGIITLGLRYGLSIILPIVTSFFLAFSVIEDSGYLPRLAMLIDRLFKAIGLSGRAVIPIVLGFGCDTMATLVTRTLETRREKLIATFLLALAIPCSAQLGVVLALLAGHPEALWIWAGVIAANFLFIGYLSARLLPGERPLFYMEVPPLRCPQFGNVLAKTFTRVHWYLKEVLPLFIAASAVIWLGRITGLFDAVVRGLEPVVKLLGLPAESAVAFLFGFFRRDYGAAGLYDLHQTGILGGISLVVSAVTLTLFVPCIAQFTVTAKERGWRTAVAMAAFIFPYAFFIGWLVNLVLTGLGVRL